MKEGPAFVFQHGLCGDTLRTKLDPGLTIRTAHKLVVHPLAKAKELAAIIPHSHMVEITGKADSRERYRDEFRAALSAFLKSA